VRKPNQLELRGAIDMVSRALGHVVRGHRYDEWGDGHYFEPEIEAADRLLTHIIWSLQYDLRKMNNADV